MLSSVFVFCFIRKRCAEATDSDCALVEMCFSLCFFGDWESACYLCSPRLLQDWNLNAGPPSEVGTSKLQPVNYIHRRRTGNIFKDCRREDAKIPPDCNICADCASETMRRVQNTLG